VRTEAGSGNALAKTAKIAKEDKAIEYPEQEKFWR
jgi:hypothetical protein